MENFKQGQELDFDVYGTKIKGKYLSMIKKKTMKIEVIYDSSEVVEVGCSTNIHQSFLVQQDGLKNETENNDSGAVISCKKTYPRDEVITLMEKLLKATGGEIKTTMHIKESRVEFDGNDLRSWIERNV